jgi:hypothetical protein
MMRGMVRKGRGGRRCRRIGQRAFLVRMVAAAAAVAVVMTGVWTVLVAVKVKIL